MGLIERVRAPIEGLVPSGSEQLSQAARFRACYVQTTSPDRDGDGRSVERIGNSHVVPSFRDHREEGLGFGAAPRPTSQRCRHRFPGLGGGLSPHSPPLPELSEFDLDRTEGAAKRLRYLDLSPSFLDHRQHRIDFDLGPGGSPPRGRA